MSRTVAMFNVVMLGLCFMLVFTAFQTGAMIQTKVLETYRNETNGTDHPYTADGYTSLAIIYLVFAFSNWFSAPLVVILGPRVTMIIGAVIYCGFIAHFIKPITWLLYVMSALLGVAAAVIWTAQGNFLTLNSTKATMSRNSGIFWALFQSSLLFGNLFVYFQFSGKGSIDDSSRETVYGVLTVTGAIGTLLMLTLRPAQIDETEAVINSDLERVSPWSKMATEFKVSVKMFFSKNMFLLSLGFFYTGLELTFFSSVYGTMISHMDEFGNDANKLIGINGILIGCGEISGGLLFGIFGKQTNKYGKDLIVMLGFVVHVVTFFLIFINSPSDSPRQDTSATVYVQNWSVNSREGIALFCSYLLGFADSCWQTQMMGIVGTIYSDQSGPAFSLFKFAQSLAAAAGFFYSAHLDLEYQLLILVIFATFGVIGFCIVERTAGLEDRGVYEIIPQGSPEQT